MERPLGQPVLERGIEFRRGAPPAVEAHRKLSGVAEVRFETDGCIVAKAETPN